MQTQREGLGKLAIAARRQSFGENVLPKPKGVSPFAIYLRQFKSPLIFLLLIAAAISLVIQEASDAVFIFIVLQINAFIGAAQEWKAETSAQALCGMIPPRVIVRREGMGYEVESRELVPGDILLLEEGASVPADLRLLWGRDLRVDESLLTGESLPIAKTDAAAMSEANPPLILSVIGAGRPCWRDVCAGPSRRSWGWAACARDVVDPGTPCHRPDPSDGNL